MGGQRARLSPSRIMPLTMDERNGAVIPCRPPQRVVVVVSV